jgi:hypothetical protein
MRTRPSRARLASIPRMVLTQDKGQFSFGRSAHVLSTSVGYPMRWVERQCQERGCFNQHQGDNPLAWRTPHLAAELTNYAFSVATLEIFVRRTAQKFVESLLDARPGEPVGVIVIPYKNAARRHERPPSP